MSKVKALVLLSGGLDSMLAVKILQAQGIEVEGLCFVSNFYNAKKAEISAEQVGIKLHIIEIAQEMLALVKNPPHGYGKNMNPCIDCHGMMFKMAGEFAKKNNFDFIASGEVLGQRPFSQNKQSLREVEKIAGIEIIRPLSAKLLPETEAEKKNLVKRHKLYNIEGRGREEQFKLAKRFSIKDFPTPSGGCLLTDPELSDKLNRMLSYWPDCDVNDVELLKNGRVYWFKKRDDKHVLLVIGRKEEENEKLENIAKHGDVIIELKDVPGPLSLLRFNILDLEIKNDNVKLNIPEELKKSELKLGEEKKINEIIEVASLLTGWYAVKARGKEVKLELKNLL